MLDPRRMVLVVALTSCSPTRAGFEAPGAAVEAFCRSYAITSVQVDPVTYHVATPNTLLESAEGAGPRTLNVAVSDAVLPQISLTGTFTPSKSDLSKALGYSVTESVTLAADSSVLIPINAYARVEAYAAFQRATLTLGAECPFPTVVGSGVALKPVGIYFETCGCIGPDPCGPGCSPLFGGPLAGPPLAGPPLAGPPLAGPPLAGPPPDGGAGDPTSPDGGASDGG